VKNKLENYLTYHATGLTQKKTMMQTREQSENCTYYWEVSESIGQRMVHDVRNIHAMKRQKALERLHTDLETKPTDPGL
jgi:hypothetical protein